MATIGFGNTVIGRVSGNTYRVDRSKMSSSRIRQIENEFRRARSEAETRRQQAEVERSRREAEARNIQYEERLAERSFDDSSVTRVATPSVTGAVSTSFQQAVERSRKPVDVRRAEREALAEARKIKKEAEAAREAERRAAIGETFATFSGVRPSQFYETGKYTLGLPELPKGGGPKGGNAKITKVKTGFKVEAPGAKTMVFNTLQGAEKHIERKKLSLSPGSPIQRTRFGNYLVTNPQTGEKKDFISYKAAKTYAIDEGISLRQKPKTYRASDIFGPKPKNLEELKRRQEQQQKYLEVFGTEFGGAMGGILTPESAKAVGFSRLFERESERRYREGERLPEYVPRKVEVVKQPEIKTNIIATGLQTIGTKIYTPETQVKGVRPQIIRQTPSKVGIELALPSSVKKIVGREIPKKIKEPKLVSERPRLISSGYVDPLTSDEYTQASIFTGFEIVAEGAKGIAKGLKKGETIKVLGRGAIGAGKGLIKGAAGGIAFIIGERLGGPLGEIESSITQKSYEFGSTAFKKYAPQKLQDILPESSGRVIKEGITGPFGPFLAPINIAGEETARFVRGQILKYKGFDDKTISDVEKYLDSPEVISKQRARIGKESTGFLSSGVGLYGAERVLDVAGKKISQRLITKKSLTEPTLKGFIISQKLKSSTGKELTVSALKAKQPQVDKTLTNLKISFKPIQKVTIKQPIKRITSIELAKEGTKETVLGLNKMVTSKKEYISFSNIEKIIAGKKGGTGKSIAFPFDKKYSIGFLKPKRTVISGRGTKLQPGFQYTDKTLLSEKGIKKTRDIPKQITEIKKAGQEIESYTFLKTKQGDTITQGYVRGKTKIFEETIENIAFDKRTGRKIKGFIKPKTTKISESYIASFKDTQKQLRISGTEDKSFIDLTVTKRNIGKNPVFEIMGRRVEDKVTTPFRFTQTQIPEALLKKSPPAKTLTYLDYKKTYGKKGMLSTKFGEPVFIETDRIAGLKQVFPKSKTPIFPKETKSGAAILKFKEAKSKTLSSLDKISPKRAFNFIATSLKKPKLVSKKGVSVSASQLPKYVPSQIVEGYKSYDTTYPPGFDPGFRPIQQPPSTGEEFIYPNYLRDKRSTSNDGESLPRIKRRPKVQPVFDIEQVKTPKLRKIDLQKPEPYTPQEYISESIQINKQGMDTSSFMGSSYFVNTIINKPRPPKPPRPPIPKPPKTPKYRSFKLPTALGLPSLGGQTFGFSQPAYFKRFFRPSKVTKGSEALDFVLGSKIKKKKGKRRKKIDWF